MQTSQIIQEIQRLPLSKRFYIMEQTLKSIKKEELSYHADDDFDDRAELSVSEKSLAKDWLSKEDDQWDKIL